MQVGDDLNHETLAEMSKKYGDVFLLKMGSRNVVVVSSPEIAKDVLFTKGVEFGSRSSNIVWDIFTGRGQDMVFSTYGDHWRKMRRIATPPFFTNKAVQRLQGGWEDETDRAVEDLKHRPESATSGVVIRKRLQLLMYNVIYRMIFDTRFESEEDPLFLKLRALNLARSQLTQSFEYNSADFIPILRPFLRGFLQLCRETNRKRNAIFKSFLDDRK
jgi:trans-cinnamate 4-monooxygenase